MLKIVVIDDENVVRNGIVLETDWASLDCEVVAEASNGEEGLEVIRKYRPDIVISDIRMPKMDGIGMLKRLREEGDKTYVIFLSAYNEFSYAQQAVKYSAADYLLKPYDDGDLEQAIIRIRDVLTKHKQNADDKHEEEVLSRNALVRTGKSKYVSDALDYIGEHLSDPDINIRSIAEAIDLSESHLSHIFKKETDYTVNAYITRYRIRTAMKLLKSRKHKIYEVAELVGYRDIAYFSTIFKKITGLNPSEYQGASPAGRT
ncbi:MAG: response regulator [Lachnospiraceae bacterium]|nr:response regulator [Lachnospiraceae bacterium]